MQHSDGPSALQFINSVGNWYTYVSIISLINTLAEGSSMAIAVFMTLRFIPYVFFAPLTGVVADRRACTHAWCPWWTPTAPLAHVWHMQVS